MGATFTVGSIVNAGGRDWIVLPRPIGTS